MTATPIRETATPNTNAAESGEIRVRREIQVGRAERYRCDERGRGAGCFAGWGGVGRGVTTPPRPCRLLSAGSGARRVGAACWGAWGGLGSWGV